MGAINILKTAKMGIITLGLLVVIISNWDVVQDWGETYRDDHHENIVEIKDQIVDNSLENISNLRDEYEDDLLDLGEDSFEITREVVEDLDDEYAEDLREFRHRVSSKVKEVLTEKFKSTSEILIEKSEKKLLEKVNESLNSENEDKEKDD